MIGIPEKIIFKYKDGRTLVFMHIENLAVEEHSDYYFATIQCAMTKAELYEQTSLPKKDKQRDANGL
jgi:hypothetical protein